MEAGYLTAFTTGFLGGFGHCIGMCGPVVASYSFYRDQSVSGKLITHILYNTGRLSTYMFVGAASGFIGSAVNNAGGLAGFQNVIAVIAGLFMILMGLNVTGIFSNPGWLERHNIQILKIGKDLLAESSVWKYFPLGAIFGLMPCGLSYSMFMSSAGTGAALSGMLVTFFFGIGTFPAMVLFGLTASCISNALRGFLYKSAGIVIIFMGLFYILRAAGIHV